jgi:ribosomal protein L11 methyltransferase
MEEYAKRIVPGGYLFLSGFYASDVPLLEESAASYGLLLQAQTEKEQWTCLRLQKV